MKINISTHVGPNLHFVMDNIVKNKILSETKSSLKTQISPVWHQHYSTNLTAVYNGWSYSLLTSTAMIGVQMRKVFKLG
jgi:hypothetical protein